MFAKILATIFWFILSITLIAIPIVILTPNKGEGIYWLGWFLLIIISVITSSTLTTLGLNKIWGKTTNTKKE
jgi:hypothetical protein